MPVVDAALADLSAEFAKLYAPIGRPSIPPEKLLRALLLQAFYSVRSERQLMEQLDYNLLFRWFVGLAIDEPVWDVTVFTKNRERLLDGDIAAKFLAGGAEPAAGQGAAVGRALHGRRHADRSLGQHEELQAQADGGIDAGERRWRAGATPSATSTASERSNATHASTTDPDARLFRKGRGKEAKLCFMGHLLMENRHGLFVDTRLSEATGTAERDAALTMLGRQAGRHRITLGADKAYDAAAFVADLRNLKVTPHVAQNTGPPLGDRRPDHAPSRLCGQPADPQADRGELRLDQDRGRPAQDPPPRHRAGRLAVHPDRDRLQPDPAAQAAGGRLIMPGRRPERSAAGPDGGPGFSKAPFPTFKEENRAANHLISAAC